MNALQILLIKRASHPFMNKWALPGGFCKPTETVYETAKRELFEETGVKISEKKVTFYRLATKPGGARQTMNASHYAFFDKEETLNWVFTSEFSENGETEEILAAGVCGLQSGAAGYL